MDISYHAQYKAPGLFRKWQAFKKVTGDGFVIDNGLQLRYFELQNGEMVYFPATWEVRFGGSRKLAKYKAVKKEAGQ